MAERNPEIVSASEIASWSWCPESWRLQTLGNEPSNQPAMEKGTAFHARKATFEERSRSAILAGWWLLVAAVALAALGIILARS